MRGWIAALALAGVLAWGWTHQARDAAPAGNPGPSSERTEWPAYLPAEALDTLRRIEAGGPFAHRQDGGTFQNRERRLPSRSRGYYPEYTDETPGSRDRGARRIIAGGDPPVEYFYTDDHYGSFRRFVPRGRP
jgi:guanyl-specific ribonuclease Sa